ncbi:hypothetical protein ACFSO0_03410 [Brevibacillus sp. GCM10020057]|uniref:hypothetical protein n=1 Tax=Brevibacillus sp. GCM10020057 TaxID=3317327 RepID=UPI003628E731
MTYNNTNMMHTQQQTHIPGAYGQASAMFQPGYANTNTQEVQYWNSGGHTPSNQPTYGMAHGGGFTGSAQAMFQPGYANTNVQEVRQLNAGYAAPQQGYAQAQMNTYQQTQPINYLHPHQTGYLHTQPGNYSMQATQTAYQPVFGSTVNSIFSPGFAGTNVQEVQQRNHTAYTGQTAYTGNTGYSAPLGGSANAIFSPGFAGTNVQEVRQLNQGNAMSSGVMSSGYSIHPAQQQQSQQAYQNYNASLGGVQSIFSPGFAGTNVQEVRSLNHGGQASAHVGSIFPGSI